MKRICRTPGCGREAKDSHPACSTCGMQAWRKSDPVRAMYTNLKWNAKRRGKVFTLTLEQFRETIRLNNVAIEEMGRERDALSVDRVDNSKGYEEGNIDFITMDENRKKYIEHDRRQEQDCPF